MANRVCWNCQTKSHHTAFGSVTKVPDDLRYFLSFVCDECGVLSVAELWDHSVSPSSAKSVMDAPDSAVVWHPANALGKDFPDVPGHIAAAASEAHTCHSVNAYRSAILMSRAVVEATAKDKGVTSGTLAAKIAQLETDGFVRALIKDTADEIRFLGNDMAHGDFVTAVDEVDSADVLAFMDEVLEEVYQAPARVNARKAERTARKAAAEAAQT